MQQLRWPFFVKLTAVELLVSVVLFFRTHAAEVWCAKLVVCQTMHSDMETELINNDKYFFFCKEKH